MVKKGLKVGEKIYAKWPGSSKFYEAIIDEILEDKFIVTFSEGSMTTAVEDRHVYVSFCCNLLWELCKAITCSYN